MYNEFAIDFDFYLFLANILSKQFKCTFAHHKTLMKLTYVSVTAHMKQHVIKQ